MCYLMLDSTPGDDVFGVTGSRVYTHIRACIMDRILNLSQDAVLAEAKLFTYAMTEPEVTATSLIDTVSAMKPALKTFPTKIKDAVKNSRNLEDVFPAFAPTDYVQALSSALSTRVCVCTARCKQRRRRHPPRHAARPRLD